MLSLQETVPLWDYLAGTKRPVLLYGMGNGADAILDECERRQIPCAGIFASDDFVRHQLFRGYVVTDYQTLTEQYPDAIILIAFASERPEILERFFRIAKEHETYAPHLPLFGDASVVSPAWLLDHEEALEEVYERLADVKSQAVMKSILNYKISGKLSYLKNVTSRRQDLESLFDLGDKESYADLGAYTGDTIAEFLSLTDHHYEHIYAVEPDPRNFAKLKWFAETEQLRNCSLFCKAIWSGDTSLSFAARGGRMSRLDLEGNDRVQGITLDEMVGERPVSYIKMDVEGAEEEALLGGQQCIRRERPRMMVAGYHHDDDLWRLPLLIWRICPDYQIYLRRHPYVPCWEINFFATIC
jgi:FkbM family methyltransferase